MAGLSPKSRWWWVGPAASTVIFLASIGVLYVILQEIDSAKVLGALAETGRETLWIALGFTALSYSLLTFYDALALNKLGLSIPYRTTALASYTSFSISFTLGFPLVTAGTVRYWIYSGRGMRTAEVAKLTVIVGMTFWLGMTAVLGVALLYSPQTIAVLARATPTIIQGVGVAILLMVAVYLAWVAGGHRAIEVRGWRLELPGATMSTAQILLGAGDVCAAAAVLYVLLPAGHGVAFETFLAIYVFACVVGVASHLPGGVGAFEATMLIGLAHLPREPVLSALLLFRLIYYITPFVIALMMLGLYEVSKRLRARPD
ncbi:MAG: lysylphosphatidylglycerol synthase transmembrane domain-containing protein [Bosea sp. (in: a-proteobacteria)]